MNFIFLAAGKTSSLVPILTLIKYKPELIVGCVLLGENEPQTMPPDWFIDATNSDNPAASLLDEVIKEQKLEKLDVFLIVKEPGSLLQFTVLAAINCCNLNYSGTGGSGGKTVLELLAKHNIRTYPAEVPRPSERNEAMKEAFYHGFNNVAEKWLPDTWGLEAVRYY